MTKILTNKTSAIIKALKVLYPRAETALNFRTDWELMVAVILSAQTTDKKVNEVTKLLFKRFKSLKDYTNVSVSQFAKDIKSVNYYKTKAKNILKTARIIKEKYNGQLPKSIDELIGLPGVGRKTANVMLGQAYGIASGIAVDTHVMRLVRLFGLTKHKDPSRIEKDLMAIVSPKDWIYFSNALIWYGREYCPARHVHINCPLKRFIVNSKTKNQKSK